ncbi:MAG: class I SAM-dependent methyltransferase [Candidatus Hodarchaeales archaeon]|jgi:methyltransferase (TIGR00027 family)
MVDDYQTYAHNFTMRIIPTMEKIINVYVKNPKNGLDSYFNFILEIKPSIENIVKELRNPMEVGIISPRLLRDPTTLGFLENSRSSEEEFSHIVGYLKGILLLGYFRSKGFTGVNFSESILPEHLRKSKDKLVNLRQLIKYVKEEMEEITLPHRDRTKFSNQPSQTAIPYYDFSQEEEEDRDEKSAVPFTARLMAYYRAQEYTQENPLILDPLARQLAGDMTQYSDIHKFVSARGDYPIVRSFYIENNLLLDWSLTQKNSQIVLLGAGLDTRAYRFQSLQQQEHTVFELDFEVINQYKTNMLKNEIPLCKLVRISTDLSNSAWFSDLLKSGFSLNVPTFWIFEGIVYYLERKIVESILQQVADLSFDGSIIFVDVCVPALAELKFGPFARYFKWGIQISEIPSFFAQFGWDVEGSYADEYDQGRDVGQRGLIFVHGKRKF